MAGQTRHDELNYYRTIDNSNCILLFICFISKEHCKSQSGYLVSVHNVRFFRYTRFENSHLLQ